jgi:MFS family permease
MAALMVPQVMSLMQVMYKPHERGSINGLFGALGGLAASLGPVIGGLLIKLNLFSLDWRPIFLINVPIGILGLIGAVRYLPNGKSPHPLRLDITGTVLVMIAMFLLVFPLIEGRELGWPNWTYLMMFLSLPGFLGFAWWQRRKERTDSSPLVLPALFKNPSFGVGLGVNLIFEMAMIGFFLTFTLILQIGLGYTAIHAALTGIPTAVGIAMTMAILGEKVVPKMGRYALTSGTIIMAVGLVATTWVLHRYQLQVHSWQLIVPLFVVGIGMGLVFGALFAAVLNGVDASHAGSASGVLNAIQQVGGAIGVALIGVVFFGQLSHGAVNSFSTVEPRLHTALTSAHIPGNQQNRIIAGVQQCFVDRSRAKDDKVVPASCHNLNTQTNDTTLTNAIAGSALQANATNFSQAFKWSIVYDLGLLAVTCALSFVLPAHFRTEAYSELA